MADDLRWPEGTTWPKVYDPNKTPKWRWESNTDPLNSIKETYYWKEQAEYWKDRYTKALRAYENLFPSGETAGRIVMLYWDGLTWIRLPDGPNNMAEQERLAKEIAYQKAESATFQSATVADIEPPPPKTPTIERTRRNNVVT